MTWEWIAEKLAIGAGAYVCAQPRLTVQPETRYHQTQA